MDVKTIVFYTCAVLLGLALTSTPRSSAARFPIFCCLTINVFLEKLLVSFVFSQITSGDDAQQAAITFEALPFLLSRSASPTSLHLITERGPSKESP